MDMYLYTLYILMYSLPSSWQRRELHIVQIDGEFAPSEGEFGVAYEVK
jgi:hypothetical protein